MDDSIAASRQKMVDAMRALVADVRVVDRTEAELLRQGGSFDVNRYFSVLPHLSMEPGYVLDYAYSDRPHIYARKMDEPRCLELSEVRDREGERTRAEFWLAFEHDAYGFHYHIQVDGAEDGFFQLVLLLVMGGQFYLFWHALKNDTTIVCTPAGLEAVLAKGDVVGRPLPKRVFQESKGLDLAPEVEMGSEQVLVRVAQFTSWGGLSRVTYHLQRAFPHRVVDLQREKLVPHTCWVIF